LVDANLRRPSIHRFFGIDRDPGLTDVLVGNQRWEDCIRTTADILMGRFEMEDIMVAPGLDNLHLLESGPIPANPSELLAMPQMDEFLRQVRQQYDIVFIDAPPVLPVTDASIIASKVDGVILVYQAGKVGRLALKRAKVQLESTKAKVWGVVLNDLGAEIAGYAPYTHYYTHYYGEEWAPDEARSALQGLLARVAGSLRNFRLPGRQPTPASEERAEGAAPAGQPGAEAAPAPPGRPRYRQFWTGILLLVALGLFLAGLLAWRMGFLALTGRGPVKELFRSTLSERTAPPRSVTPPAATPAPAPPPAEPSAEVPQGASPERPTPGGPPAPAAQPPPAEAPRYALEFGPFPTADEAERVERQLNSGGFPTVKFRQQGGGNLYGVFLERLPGQSEAQAIVERLKGEGFPQDVITGSEENLAIRIGEPAPLRTAVQVAERLRALDYKVRVAVVPGEAPSLTIRHGNFASEEEARARSQDLVRQGLSNRIVRVK
jgi:hypothetical protein